MSERTSVQWASSHRDVWILFQFAIVHFCSYKTWGTVSPSEVRTLLAGDAALYLSVDPDFAWVNVSVSSESRKGAPRSLTSGQPSRRRLIRNLSVPRHMHGSGESWVVCRGCAKPGWICCSPGQASPKPGHEKALRMVLRCLITDMKVGQRFPTEGELSDDAETLLVHTDAGFARRSEGIRDR